MFELITDVAHPPYFVSTRLTDCGVRHAFTTRGSNVQSADDAAGFVASLRWPATSVRLTRQIHGHGVTTDALSVQADTCADAHLTSQAGKTLAVRTADCVPILLSTRDGRWVAAIHAGWRGLDPAVQVIGHTLGALRAQATAATSDSGLFAAIGPCIGVAHYPVGPEMAERFAADYPAAVRHDCSPQAHLDLRCIARSQLLAAGLKPDAIDMYPGCTFAEADRFYSYRRDGRTGHQAALIAPTTPGQ